jgi:hypothetical protein
MEDKYMKSLGGILLGLLLLVTAVGAASTQWSIYCRPHQVDAYFQRTEGFGERCSRVYQHSYFENGRTYNHLLYTACN